MKHSTTYVAAFLTLFTLSTAALPSGMTLHVSNMTNKDVMISFDTNHYFRFCDSGENYPIRLAANTTKTEWCGYKDDPEIRAFMKGTLTVKLLDIHTVNLAEFSTMAAASQTPWNQKITKLPVVWGQSGLKDFTQHCYAVSGGDSNCDLTIY